MLACLSSSSGKEPVKTGLAQRLGVLINSRSVKNMAKLNLPTSQPCPAYLEYALNTYSGQNYVAQSLCCSRMLSGSWNLLNAGMEKPLHCRVLVSFGDLGLTGSCGLL